MNKWFLLLLLVGLAIAGGLNRERISEWLGHKTVEEEPPPPPPVRPPPTPNPATESVALARRAYPALAMQGSAFNVRFVTLFNQLKVSDPDFLAQPDWPVRLAERTATELGGGAMPLVTPRAGNHLSGSSTLDARPGASGTPPVTLPGIQGSALDARPVSKSTR